MLHYLKKYWFFALLAAAAMIGEVAVDLIQPRLMAVIVDDGILGLKSGGIPDMDLVLTTGIRMILIVILGGLSGILCGVFINLCAQRYGNDIRKDCFRRIMHFSFEQTDDFTTGSLITRMTSDITQVQNMVSQLIRGGIRCCMFFTAGSFALVSLDVSFGIVVAIAIPLILLEIGFIVWKTNPLFTLLQKKLDRVNAVLQENIAGARVVKAFVQEKRESERFGGANEDLVDVQLRVLILMSYMRPVMNIVLNLATVAILHIGSIQVQAGRMAPGTIMAAITYISQILNGMMMLAMLFQTISRGLASSRRLKELLDSRPTILDGDHTEETGQRGSIVFEHVSFRYPGQSRDILHDIDLTVRPGETVAVVGATGSGKTSLLNLIPRFYDVSEGRVLVDDADVRDYPLHTLREKIAVVLQKSELFSATIRENIAWGAPEAGDDAIRTAAVTAQAESFITAQPEGYDTPVAEAGMSLSGGQRQRVAIARALVKNAGILLLDDATSALDLKTEAAFYDALKTNYGAMTKIIVAQRIASIRNADRIAVLDGGTLFACGTHAQLLETCSVYREICQSQTIEEGLDHE